VIVVNKCTCECRRDWPINIFDKSETRVNLLVALPTKHVTIVIQCKHAGYVSSRLSDDEGKCVISTVRIDVPLQFHDSAT
jgi:hypothetical protein